jgi:biopolymer transport protein ExbD
MRRFSQRNSLVTLSDINITPLLDLAFVLLIIFVIISPSIKSKQEHSLDLKLPKGGGAQRQVDPSDLRLVEISPQGEYMLQGRRRGAGPPGAGRVVEELMHVKRLRPNLVVRIRADENGVLKHFAAVVDGCLRNGITDFSWATEPIAQR